MRSLSVCAVTVILCSALTGVVALPPPGTATKVRLQSAQTVDASHYANANRLLGFILNQGNLFYDAGQTFGKNDGLYYPYLRVQDILDGSRSSTVMFDAGLWMAGKVSGQVRGAVAEYSSEYVPGPMKNGTFQSDNSLFRVYKIFSDSGQSNPNADYLAWPTNQGAPLDGSGHPLLLGNQTLFSTFNDANSAQHTNSAGASAPLGIEVRQTVYTDRGPTVTDSVSSIDQYTVSGPAQSKAKVYAWVINPSLITGHSYRVVIHPDAVNGQSWNLIDATLNHTLLSNQATFAKTSFDGVEIDGMLLAVMAPPPGLLSGEPGQPDSGWTVPSGTRRFTELGGGGGLALQGFRGTVGWTSPAVYFTGFSNPVPAGHLRNILIELAPTDNAGNFDPNDTHVSYAYRYLRNAQNPAAKPAFQPFIINSSENYGFQDFVKSMPLAVYDNETSPPRRLAVGFLENNVSAGKVNGKYWPPYYGDAGTDNTGATGQREWLFVFDADYSQTPNAAYEVSALDNPLPIMYMATWANFTSTGWATGDKFQLFAYTGAITPDTFSFAATKPTMVPFAVGGNTTMTVRYDLFNKGANSISEMYVAFWADPDLGGAIDDLVGCDTTKGVFYCYNGTSTDLEFGAASPAVGIHIEQGPLVPSTNDTATAFGQKRPGYRNLQASAFNKFINGTDPTSLTQTYNSMKGLNINGTPYTYSGQPVKFMNSGDPVAGTGDIDVNPADRRMMVSVGPFNFLPGDSQQVIVKWGVGQGTNALASVTALKDLIGTGAVPPSCCTGTTGNVNMTGIVDLSDLALLVSRLIEIPPPSLPCPDEANVNGVGIIDLSDLALLVSYLIDTPPPTLPNCP